MWDMHLSLLVNKCFHESLCCIHAMKLIWLIQGFNFIRKIDCVCIHNCSWLRLFSEKFVVITFPCTYSRRTLPRVVMENLLPIPLKLNSQWSTVSFLMTKSSCIVLKNSSFDRMKHWQKGDLDGSITLPCSKYLAMLSKIYIK